LISEGSQRDNDDLPDQIDTVVIGGGQAGLAAGYFLQRHDIPFVILDAQERVGDSWRKRWDSLRLFTPGRYDSLPGSPFPGPSHHHPTKDELADYLESYAARFELPVHLGVEVQALTRQGEMFETICDGHLIRSQNAIVATGFDNRPNVPSFATELHSDILQLHSKEYRNPSQLKEGGVLVVGAANSGAEISVEVAGQGHPTWLSGRDPGNEPTRAGTLPDRLFTRLMWFAASRVVTVDRAIGRKVRDAFLDPPRGVPRGRVKRKDILAAGIEWVARTKGVRDGYPLLEDGRVLDVPNVIWCTGFTPGLDWIDLTVTDGHGIPIHERGVADGVDGLYFVGLYFQYSLSSPLVGGVGRDAGYVVDHLVSSRRVGATVGSVWRPSSG
jgi:putative flavoprotein involved in K+ transport